VTRNPRTDAGRVLHGELCETPEAAPDHEFELTADYVTLVWISLVMVARRRFAPGSDPREIAALVRQIAVLEPTLRRREAEALVRFVCGEWELRTAMEWELTFDAQLIVLRWLVAELALLESEVVEMIIEAECHLEVVKRYTMSVGGVSALEQMLRTGEGPFPRSSVSHG
jgi:hypothetical protein